MSKAVSQMSCCSTNSKVVPSRQEFQPGKLAIGAGIRSPRGNGWSTVVVAHVNASKMLLGYTLSTPQLTPRVIKNLQYS